MQQPERPPQEPWQRHEQHWGRRPPPWMYARAAGQWRPGPWSHDWHVHRRLLFLRFLLAFGLILLLTLGGMGIMAYLVNHWFGGNGHTTVIVWFGGCGLAFGLPIMGVVLAIRTFRRVTTPLANVMAAADAVATGDLSVRVPERGSDAFARLAHSFNQMVTELERNDQQRRNLTADVAHELRTPLHIIQGNLEGVLDGVYEPTTDHINATLDETRHLARLVDDLRTLSLAESGQLPLIRKVVDVRDLLADVAVSFGAQAEMKGIELRVSDFGLRVTGKAAVGEDELLIEADAGRLNQVLSNLVMNALRHTPAGGQIRLEAMRQGELVCIRVCDTGEGIAATDLPYLFDRFWRGDRARTHTEGVGSGLGLAIARQLVQAHGGQITADSTVGQGTTFTLTLPGTPQAG
jgi:two-component system sensor histidine kinase BaeS